MKIIISEQQASEILKLYADLISNVLLQKNIQVKDVKVVPIFFPERGLRAIIKLESGQNKDLARKLIKGILGGVSNFGQNKEVTLS